MPCGEVKVESKLEKEANSLYLSTMAKLLVVDDEPSMRIGLKDNLEFESFEVEMAMNGQVAFEKIQRDS